MEENADGVTAASSEVRVYRRRRKRAKMTISSEDQMDKTVNKPPDIQFHNSSCYQTSVARMDSNASTNGSNDSSRRVWRNVVLEQLYHSLNETEGGIQECIQDALAFHPQGSCTSTVKESVQFSEELHNGTHNASNDGVGVVPNGSADESVNTNTDVCKRAVFDVLISTKFAELCDLLYLNFQGPKINGLFDFSLISSRIKEGAYESSPVLFQLDIQQVWTKFEKIGTEMVALAKSLTEKSTVSCLDKQYPLQEFHRPAKVEQTEGSYWNKACTCSCCEEKAEGSDCLVCDHCEKIYHVSCIVPSLKEIPLETWYCASCKAKGVGSSHESCVVCETISSPRCLIPGIDKIVANEEELEPEERSDDLEEAVLRKEDTKSLPNCKICAESIGNEMFRLCGQPLCPSKFYHLRCLTVKQLNSYTSCWFCPSCLCRVCRTDRDGDKIILCDGCDQAFHSYCVQPPCSSIPRGNWFCAECDEGIQRIRKVKQAYENTSRKVEENVHMKM